ncbi:hypothetical protein [Chryseobacterium sp. FH1]|uniref:hypothetical protein n=1 Tax=Chryseobacterium sp. FH1 TaxID=1233951 RepID=UPI0004E39FDF|nr:hypothetical protein [Chryseobacterium sp. FH1]KFC19347.1 hypothetical protein IO90_08560 [Chryseobacterium sp. FH1]
MKIAGCVIRKIIEKSPKYFEAEYKGYHIYVSTNHGFGKPKDKNLKRFNIEVTHIESGIYGVNTWEDFETIEKAIEYALEGSLLAKNTLPKPK